MQFKKITAIFLVVIMATLPLMALANDAEGASADSDDGWKTGTRVVLHDLDTKKMASLGWPDWGTDTASNDDPFSPWLPELFELGRLFILLMPGINYEPFDTEANASVLPEVAGLDFEIDYTEYISADGKECKYLLGLDVSADKVKYTATPTAGELILMRSPSHIIGWDAIYNPLRSGDYSRALISDFGDDKWDGSSVELELTFDFKIYLEVSMKAENVDENTFAFVSGGYQTAIAGQEESEKQFPPISKLCVDLDASIKSTFKGTPVQFDTKLKLDESMDIERHYLEPYSQLHTGDEDGSMYFDNVKDAKLVISECSKYNGNENGKLFDFDFTEQWKSLVDGRPFVLKDYGLYNVGHGLYKQNVLNYSDIIPKASEMSSNDDAKEQKAIQLMLAADENAEMTHDYAEVEKCANGVKSSINGGSSDNTMLIVGIVIAILIIIAIIALWYFKFRY